MEQFLETDEVIPEISVYTDGACSNNGKKYARAGVGVFFGENDPRNVSRELSGNKTNNIAELSAIIIAYYVLEDEISEGKAIMIYTDSQYAMRCCTTYGKKMAKKGWCKKRGPKKGQPIPNKELVQRAYELFKGKTNIQFKHVRAHTGLNDKHSVGNAGADRLANEAIGVTQCPYQEKRGTRRIYLDVPYIKKDEVKKFGARWDPKKKKWYIMSDLSEQRRSAILNILARG
jgi:ribonuclease HI